ncbi:MAG: ribosome silencing factor [Candidatus Omnitrophica bacterium]|nr:ribosome silencing factor [Candidatus Omnitrophota bacterium]
MKPKNNALAIAGAASDKKALDIVLVKMKKMSSVCDWFVIASGTSTTHTRAIADNIVKKLKEKREKLWHKEGEREASWILLDYGDVVAHIFLEETRAFYDLERLWGDAPQERFKERKPKKRITRKVRVKRSKK